MADQVQQQEEAALVALSQDGKIVVKAMTVAIASRIIQHLQALIASAVIGEE